MGATSIKYTKCINFYLVRGRSYDNFSMRKGFLPKFAHTRTHTYTSALTHTHLHTHIHTLTHTHTLTQEQDALLADWVSKYTHNY